MSIYITLKHQSNVYLCILSRSGSKSLLILPSALKELSYYREFFFFFGKTNTHKMAFSCDFDISILDVVDSLAFKSHFWDFQLVFFFQSFMIFFLFVILFFILKENLLVLNIKKNLLEGFNDDNKWPLRILCMIVTPQVSIKFLWGGRDKGRGSTF